MEIHIRASSTTLPPMNLIDLPGLVQSDATLGQQTRQILDRFIANSQQKDVFLVVVSGLETPSNWTAMKIVKDAQLEDRTIGVITKFDRRGEVTAGCLSACVKPAG